MLPVASRVYVAIFVLLSTGVLSSHAANSDKLVLKFRLYTRGNPTQYEEIDATGSRLMIMFNSHRPTRIFIHGFKSDDTVIIPYKDAYLAHGDYNFIAVDWQKSAATNNYWTV